MFELKAAEWLEQAKLWAEERHPDQLDGTVAGFRARNPREGVGSFYDWHGGPPDAPGERGGSAYLTEPADRDLWQMYETVSEGKPMSPPLETGEELVDWIVENLKHSREAAAKFVELGHAPTFAMSEGRVKKMDLEIYEPGKGSEND